MQNEIIHVALVLDASSSMTRLATKLVETADEQIRFMAKRSEELDVETRVSVYTFADAFNIKCVIFDKDVFRLPSIAGLYKPYGNTALIDATILSQNDLAETFQKYGKHSFLSFVLTDGQENASRNFPNALRSLLSRQGDNWSVAALVPDNKARSAAVNCGFPENNVMVWDVSTQGLEKAAKTVQTATDMYMTTVSRGGTVDKNNVFGTGTDKVNAQTVQATLVPLTPGSYELYDVTEDSRIDDFVRLKNRKFFVGKGYYSFTKTETIQAGKDLLVLEKATGKVYGGAGVRPLLGLSTSVDVRVRPNANPDYTILVKSTANNRKLLKGTQFVYTF